MLLMGKEHVNLLKAQETERSLMRRENQLLKKTLGLVRRSRAALAQQSAEESAAGQADGGHEDMVVEDREV